MAPAGLLPAPIMLMMLLSLLYIVQMVFAKSLRAMRYGTIYSREMQAGRIIPFVVSGIKVNKD